MKKGFLSTALALLASAGIGSAQEKLPTLTPVSSITENKPIFSGFVNAPPTCSPRLTVGGEYLLWWVSRGPVNSPLVTTGDPASATGGFIGDSSTTVLFGNRSVDFGAISGGRVSLDYWFGNDRKVGLDASGFLLENKTRSFTAASDATGNPLLALPFRDELGNENALYAAHPNFGPLVGSVAISTSTRLWGAEANGVVNLWRQGRSSLDLLVGFRYYDLSERLEITFNDSVPATGFDRFHTRNQFYGGQIGAKSELHFGCWSVNLRGQVALGVDQQTLNIDGSTTNAAGTFAGGVFTQPSNIGQFRTNHFSAIPQAQVKLGYDLSRSLRATVGYDAMYWTGVIRPVNQIDRNLNLSQNLGGNLVGAAVPTPQNNRSDFWAHGVSFGLQYSW